MATFAIDGALIVVCSIIMYFALPFNGKSVKKILCCLVTVLHWQCGVSDNQLKLSSLSAQTKSSWMEFMAPQTPSVLESEHLDERVSICYA